MTSQMIFLIALFIPITISLALIPYLTRKTENFGITIPESLYERKDFKAMRKQYAITLLIIGLLIIVALIIAGLTLHAKQIMIIYTILIFVFVIGSFVIYLPFHLKMKNIKHVENWQADRRQTYIVDMKFRQEKLTFSNWWFIIPLLIILATIIVTFIFYDAIPGQIPMHTDFGGNVRYDEKSIGNLLFLPGTQIFLLGLFIFINFIIKNAKQQVSVENPETSKQQNILYRRRWSLYLIVSAILMTILLGFAQLTFIFPVLIPYVDLVLITIVGIILIGTIILAIMTGQGGSRIKLKNEFDDSVVNRDEDQHWKLGQFYFNKNDPAIFIEKRFGVGWTNNWAHPISWIFLIIVIGLAIGIPMLLTLF